MAAKLLHFFWNCHHKTSKKNSIRSMWPSYFIPQNYQNTIIQTALKHYNQFISVRTEALRCLKIKIDSGLRIKVETEAKERDQKVLYLITIDIIKVEQQKYP